MKNIYTPIQPQKLPEEIARRMKSLIKKGELSPGEKLPPERALAEYFGVGRSSVREALRLLETLGFLEVRKREGTFIRSVSSPILSNPLKQILEEDKDKILELVDLRKDVEAASAYKAAILRTKNDLSRIESFLERMKKGVDESRFSVNAEIGFHVAIAQATHNLIRVHFVQSILNSFWEHWEVLAEKVRTKEANVSFVFNQHKRIYKAIRDGNAELSKTLMNEHLVWTEEKWKEFGREM